MSKKQLCQIQIEAGAGGVLPARRYYQCGLNGRFKAHVVGITWADRAGATDHKLITVQSDCFRMPYGSVSQSLIFGNKGDHSQHPGGDFPLYIEVMGNSIDLTITSSTPYTGAGNHIFEYGILSFTVEPMDD